MPTCVRIFHFRPQLVPTLMTLVMLATVLSLGFWQLHRLEWKETLMRTLATEVATAPQPMADPFTLPPSGYRHVWLEGEYLHEAEMPMAGRYYQNTMGYHLLTPFRLTDGRVFLVNRGWVGVLERKPQSRPDTQPAGIQRFAAMAHRVEKKRLFAPDNDPQENIWFWYDMPAMRQFTGQNMPDLVLDVIEGDGAPVSPKPARKHVELRNDHLMYAITWFSFALALLVIYVVYHQPYRKDKA